MQEHVEFCYCSLLHMYAQNCEAAPFPVCPRFCPHMHNLAALWAAQCKQQRCTWKPAHQLMAPTAKPHHLRPVTGS